MPTMHKENPVVSIKNETIEVLRSAREDASAETITLGETLDALEYGDVFDSEFWNAVAFAREALGELLEGIERKRSELV